MYAKNKKNINFLICVLHWMCMYILLIRKKNKSDGCTDDGMLGQLTKKEISLEIIIVYSKNVEKMFYRYTRMTTEHLNKLTELTTPYLRKINKRALIPEHRLIIALR